MGWFGKRRDRAAAKREQIVPPWAASFELEAFHAFLEALDDALLARELDTTREGGVVAVRLADGRPLQLGLQTLAQQCAVRPRGQWGAHIGAHLDAIIASGDEAARLERRRFEAVRDLLKVRLYPAAAVERDPELRLVATRPAPDLVAALAYDLPHAVTTVPPEDVAAWAKDEAELFTLGLANLAGEPLTRDRIDVERGLCLDVLHGPSFFVAAQLLRLEALLEARGEGPASPYGILAAVPTRHLLIYHPIVDARVLMAVNALIPQAHAHHQRGPGSLSTALYWLRAGALQRLETGVTRQGVTFRPSPDFVEEVITPLGGTAPTAL